MLKEPSDREGTNREVYRDMLVLCSATVVLIVLPYLASLWL